MGLAPSALFRYISSRDDLLTTLITTTYRELGEEVRQAEAAVSRSDHHARWTAITTTFRNWAVAHPHDYALLYGSPVPDYHAPAEVTNEPGNMVLNLLITLVHDIHAAQVATHEPKNSPARYDNDLATAAVRDLMSDPALAGIPARMVVGALAAWNLVLGSLSSELFEQLGPDVGDPQIRFALTSTLAYRLVTG